MAEPQLGVYRPAIGGHGGRSARCSGLGGIEMALWAAVGRFLGTLTGRVVLGASVVALALGGVVAANELGGSGPGQARAAIVTGDTVALHAADKF